MVALPITILTHIVQYLSVLEHSGEAFDHKSVLQSVSAGGGIQGFCAGLLSALAVASGRTEGEVVALAATSISLAFCMGAYVDLDQAGNEGGGSCYTSLAVRWRAPTTCEDIQQILLNYPGTYIAVTRDVRDVTITAPTVASGPLRSDFSQHGVSSLDTGLRGRYHAGVHKDVPAKIVKACQGRLHPRFGEQHLVRSNIDARVISHEEAVETALESILVRPANWYLAISTSTSELNKLAGNSNLILSIGTDAIPQSIAREFPVIKTKATVSSKTSLEGSSEEATNDVSYPDHAVAVIGMACKFPGADSVDEFWRLLTAGQSMLAEMPEHRFAADNLPRSPKGLRFWGNFVRDIEAFDHKFFKKSAREAASMDPQQRLLLQVAYQALEASGYFSDPSKPRDIGCYLGSCSTDYDANVGSHPPTAYSTTGTLRAFLSGRISHYFGWSGPSLVFDTACSSSAVAIHTACTALLAGECSQAIAGGVTLMTSPYLYENLSAAHFLSPTGATKPFDAAADGYCRGEGVGLVVLKKLSNALADGDNVLGVIASSAVNQNANCVSITVPHSTSQSVLYKRVADRSGINPYDLTFVEAHGTGTPVGDPIEMESIRQVFGGAQRRSPLFVSSVKGNIGHLEGASGVAALIKALLQIEYRTACVQASFKHLNPKIPPLDPDHMCIPTTNRPLSAPLISACINNYGAAGSNAAMILLEKPRRRGPPQRNTVKEDAEERTAPLAKLPVQIAAASTASLARYCELLDEFCQASPTTALNTANVAFSLARQQNQELPYMLTAVTTCTTDVKQLCSDLKQKLSESGAIKQRPKELPVVLCFGGQVGRHVGLSKRLWQRCTLFRRHLDACDETLRALGYVGIYPAIFQTEPIADVVVLQSAIFATQYASAQAWLDSGLKVSGLVGHSLGQFAALCVSGILSLRDSLQLVAGRAALMETHWGAESGTMIAVEADRQTAEELTSRLTATDSRLVFETACYNGPTSQVIVSDRASADQLEAELRRQSIRHKRLNVTHGFHSRFTEPLIPRLEALASTLTLHAAKIPIETTTEGTSWSEPSARLIAAHTRDPVFFGQAVQRLRDRLGPCTFLEAGSDSSVVSMVRRALGQQAGTGVPNDNNFIPMELNKEASLDNLAEVTVNLWNRGHQFQFWNFSRLQADEFEILRLPPYQFEESKHWLTLELASPPEEASVHQARRTEQPPPPPVLISLRGIDSSGQHFDVDPRSDEFRVLVQGHVVLGEPECPPSLYVELVARALKITGASRDEFLLSVHNLRMQTPLKLSTDGRIQLDLQPLGDQWNFSITSIERPSTVYDSGKHTVSDSHTVPHATGAVSFRAADSALLGEFARYQRLTGDSERFTSIINDANGTSLKGPVVYKVASRTVEYADFYRNVVSVASSGSQVVGRAVFPKQFPSCLEKSAVQSLVLDSLLQVASLHANHIHESAAGEMFRLSSIERIQYGPDWQYPNNTIAVENSGDKIGAWQVLCLVSVETGALVHDIFVYDAAAEKLAALLLGVRHVPVGHIVFRGSFTPTEDSRLEERPSGGQDYQATVSHHPLQPNIGSDLNNVVEGDAPTIKQKQSAARKPEMVIFEDVCTILEKIAEISRSDVRGNASFEDLGVDSLMMIEVIAEISNLYKMELPVAELEELTDFDSLVRYLHGRGCRGAGNGDSADEEEPGSRGHLSFSTGTSSTSSSSESPVPTAGTSPIITRSATPCPPTTADAKPPALDYGIHASSAALPTSHYVTLGTAQGEGGGRGLRTAQQVFDGMRFDFDKYAGQTGFSNFWEKVYPDQAALVEAYIFEAFRTLGCDLARLSAGQRVLVPPGSVLPKHDRLMDQLHKILAEGGFIETQADGSNRYARTAKPVDPTPAAVLFQRMLQTHPHHVSETSLLNVTGSRLADCLTGKADPLQLLFANRANREIMADVYEKAPMCQATSRLLAEFLARSFATSSEGGEPCDRVFQIIEVGAGTGGTAKYLVDYLASRGVRFEYTFTDISSSLVGQAKKTFAGRHMMKYATLDCDRAPPAELRAQFDVVVATNCIHATQNASLAAENMASLLRPDGVFCLVEFTRGLYWFDLVYGLLEGWWAFGDGRQHALADQWFWDNSLRAAGFKHVSWTDGPSSEARTMRVICAFPAAPERETFRPLPRGVTKKAGLPVETFKWKRAGNLELKADVYYPKTADEPGRKRPVGMK
ncbi:hypothetical protein VTI74DRAFT_6769 [Chaetomium olivicolor]